MINSRARSFVTIMIVIATTALLLRFVIGRILSITIAQNEANASVTLKSISAALENYAQDKNGVYPSSFSQLIQSEPHYLDKDYTAQFSIRGYSYNCSRFEPSGYNCSAAPVNCLLTGNQVYTVTNGNLFAAESCSSKD